MVHRSWTALPGRMDGPQVVVDGDRSNMIVRMCAALEQWAYSRMPRADVCFVLMLPLQTAVKRNRLRVKEGKETDQEIQRRFGANENVLPLAERIVEFRNDGDLEFMRNQLVLALWREFTTH